MRISKVSNNYITFNIKLKFYFYITIIEQVKEYLVNDHISNAFIQEKLLIKSGNENFKNKENNSYNSINVETTLIQEKKNKVINFSKDNFSTNLIQLGSFNGLNRVFDKPNKGARFLISFTLLLITSVISFLLVKSSVDWATNSKTELNRFREEKAKYLSDLINDKFSYIRRTE